MAISQAVSSSDPHDIHDGENDGVGTKKNDDGKKKKNKREKKYSSDKKSRSPLSPKSPQKKKNRGWHWNLDNLNLGDDDDDDTSDTGSSSSNDIDNDNDTMVSVRQLVKKIESKSESNELREQEVTSLQMAMDKQGNNELLLADELECQHRASDDEEGRSSTSNTAALDAANARIKELEGKLKNATNACAVLVAQLQFQRATTKERENYTALDEANACIEELEQKVKDATSVCETRVSKLNAEVSTLKEKLKLEQKEKDGAMYALRKAVKSYESEFPVVEDTSKMKQELCEARADAEWAVESLRASQKQCRELELMYEELLRERTTGVDGGGAKSAKPSQRYDSDALASSLHYRYCKVGRRDLFDSGNSDDDDFDESYTLSGSIHSGNSEQDDDFDESCTLFESIE